MALGAEQRPDRDRSWTLLLAAVSRLHDRGLTGIRALPYFGPVGYWRIEITTAVNLPSGVNLPARDQDAVFCASGGSFPRIGELVITDATTADDVAGEILRGLGSPIQATYFNDHEYCTWFAAMRQQAETIGSPPSAFEEFHNGWRCGATDIAPPPGWESAW